MTRANLKALLASVNALVESLRPEPITHVGPAMLGEMAAYHSSPAFYRRRRAECLHSAIWFRLLGMESGREHHRAIINCLADGRKWRQLEKPTVPVVAQRKRAA